MAPIAGRFSDRRGPRLAIGLGILTSMLSFGRMMIFPRSLAALLAGVRLMDLGGPSGHVTNQTRVFALVPHAWSRLNTVYMFSYFTGGTSGVRRRVKL